MSNQPNYTTLICWVPRVENKRCSKNTVIPFRRQSESHRYYQRTHAQPYTQTTGGHTLTHTISYLKAGSSLLHLGGGDENAFLLLKSFWKRVGGILYQNEFGTESLFPFSNPRPNLVPCNCLHGCHSHMTRISHRSSLVTHYIILIGSRDANAATTNYPIGWYFWYKYHVVSGFAVLMFCRQSWLHEIYSH